MTESMTTGTPRHVVVVVGAATAGAEIAGILAKRGAQVVVIEQNPRPYGKIEDGLPRWHVKQRRDEYEEINRRLDHPNIEFVPLTRMGVDVTYDDLRQRWGLSAIVLAHGAWRDRPLAVKGADRYIDRGLVYQNRLIYWFNHYPEKAYDGPRYDVPAATMVIGGGLASIDVVKVLQIETALRAMRARGIEEDMLRLEREGLEPVLAAHKLNSGDLGVAPCKLYYRRRVLSGVWDFITLGVLPLGAAGFLGWMFEQTLQTGTSWATRWSLIGIIAIGLVLMLVARYLLRSQFFQIPRESEPEMARGSHRH